MQKSEKLRMILRTMNNRVAVSGQNTLIISYIFGKIQITFPDFLYYS